MLWRERWKQTENIGKDSRANKDREVYKRMNNEKCQKEMKKLIKQKIKRKKRRRLQKLQVLTCRGESERERER